jgi:Protein of unknown function DUF262
MTLSRLRTRPLVQTLKVDVLLQWARDGRLRLPEFQRPLRWKPEDFVDLFDSVYRGFPIGTLLLAKQELPAGESRFGPFIAPSGKTSGFWIVDGQQRITTLVGCLLHPSDEPAGDDYSIYFDLEGEDFFVRGRRRRVPETALPLRVVRSLSTHLAWSRNWLLAPERPDLLERADSLAQAIREFEMAAAIVDGNDEQTLRQIFVRTNKSGVPLSDGEVFEALHATSPDASIRAACARLEAIGAGELDPKFFLRCALHTANFGPGTDVRDLTISSDFVSRAETALGRAISFLRSDCEVAYPDEVPQQFPLLPLAGFLNRFPTPSPRARILLRRWFWRGFVADEFADNGFGAVSRWQRIILGAVDDESAAREMLDQVPKEEVKITLPNVWSGRDRQLWFLRVAAQAMSPIETMPPQGAFLSDSRDPGGWLPVEITLGTLNGLHDERLSELGFPQELRSLLRESAEKGDPSTVRELEAKRREVLAKMTQQFVESLCESDVSDRGSVRAILAKLRGAAA